MGNKVLESLKKFIKRLNVKKLTVIFILMYTIVPIVSRAFSTYLSTYIYMGIVLLTVLYSLVTCHLRDIKTLVFSLIPFIFYEMLDLLFVKGTEDILLSGYQVLLFLMPLFMGFNMMNNHADYDLYTAVLVLSFVITAITTIIGCINNPNAARILATTSNSQDPVAIALDWQNVGGFFFSYFAVLMYPLAIIAAKTKRIRFIFGIGAAVLAISLAINTAYTMALMTVMFSSVLFFVPANIPPKRFALLFGGGLLMMVALAPLMVNFLGFVGEMIGNEEMSTKMTAVFSGADAVNDLEDNRMELYMTSLTTFIQNPILGTFLSGKMRVGGHSMIFDTLARFGLLGAGLMFMMYRAIFKNFCRPFRDKPAYSFVIWAFAQCIVMSALNTGMWLDYLCVCMPIVLCTIYRTDGNERPEGALAPQLNLNLFDKKETTS